MTRMLSGVLIVMLFGSGACYACSLCGGTPQQRQTIRQEAAGAHIVVAGKLTNPRLNADGSGTTELIVERILKDHPALKGRRTITVPRYLPIEDKSPRFLLFCDAAKGQLDVLNGRFVRDERIFDYIEAVQKLGADRIRSLQFYFKHLESPVAEIAADAYLEFAKATDAEVGAVARTVDSQRVRRLVKSDATPGERLGMYAFLLGGCGEEQDAELLLTLIRRDSPQTRAALSGLLTGYIALRPAAGWKLTASFVSDPKREFLDRLAAISAVRFFRGWKPGLYRGEEIQALSAAVDQGEVADMAIEDLRRWQWWGLTDRILVKYGMKSHDSPLVQRAILRYALACPDVVARQFVAERKKKEPDAIADAVESLEAEK